MSEQPTSKQVIEYIDRMFSGDTTSLEIRVAEWMAIKASIDAWRIMAQNRAKVIADLEGDLQVARLQRDAKRTSVEPCAVHDWRDEKEFVSCKRCNTTMAKRDLPPPPGPFTHYAEGYKAGATGFIGGPDDLDTTARQMAREYVRGLPVPPDDAREARSLLHSLYHLTDPFIRVKVRKFLERNAETETAEPPDAVSVSNRDAPLYEDVLVFDGEHWGIGSYVGHGTYSHSRYPVLGQCKATHWMPLPSLPATKDEAPIDLLETLKQLMSKSDEKPGACQCPANPGEPCPLTSEECGKRAVSRSTAGEKPATPPSLSEWLDTPAGKEAIEATREISCETEGHLWGRDACVMCKTVKPVSHRMCNCPPSKADPTRPNCQAAVAGEPWCRASAETSASNSVRRWRCDSCMVVNIGPLICINCGAEPQTGTALSEDGSR